MANKNLFISTIGKMLPRFSTRNEAGGAAYQLTPEQALAQYAATGCVNGTFYASAQEQLDQVLLLANQVEPEFLARVALYCRTKAHMKDTPALLLAVLSVRSPGLMAEIFDRVIDSPKMLRNFVQIMRSGVVGRKSLGTLPKRMVVQWLDSRSERQLFMGSTGGNPSLADVVKMVHPKPASPARAALYAYLIGKPYSPELAPKEVREFELFKADPGCLAATLPDAPMEMLAGLKLRPEHWMALARSSSWQRLRMNLNTFARHGVFKDQATTEEAAAKLRDPQEIAKARVFPYQLMVAYANVDAEVPAVLKEALQDAMEIAIAGVPAVRGRVWIFPDVSGSMHSPVTGYRKGSTTAVRCVDVAALVAAAFVRRNPQAQVIPFAESVVDVALNPRDSVMTNAQKLASLGGGGTNCSAPLAHLNARGLQGDLLVYVSDNQSWLDSAHPYAGPQATQTLVQWERFKQRNPRAKLVCLDVQPYGSCQSPGRADVLNIGGFADAVFTTIAEFNNTSADPDFWVSTIQKESL